MSEEMGRAMDDGDWARAHALFVRQPDAGTPGGIANAALLLAMMGQHDQALAQLARTQAPAVDWIVRGDQARLARWRDPSAASRLGVAQPTTTTPFYAGMAVALVTGDAALADRLMTEWGPHYRPAAGRLVLRNGQERPFNDMRDCDDAIGQMFEVFLDGTCLYFPFEMVKRVDLEEPQSFVTLYHQRVKLTMRDGRIAQGFMPLLYAGSLTSDSPFTRTGRETTFSYVGNARRGLGQRDLWIDNGTMMGIQRVAAIELG